MAVAEEVERVGPRRIELDGPVELGDRGAEIAAAIVPLGVSIDAWASSCASMRGKKDSREDGREGQSKDSRRLHQNFS